MKHKFSSMPTKMTNNNFCKRDCTCDMQSQVDRRTDVQRKGSKGDTEKSEKAQCSKKGSPGDEVKSAHMIERGNTFLSYEAQILSNAH